MLRFAEALRLLLDDVEPVGTETLPISSCAGRVLAADAIASRDQPPEALSAMDGYAVRSEDAAAGLLLRVIGESPAGAPFRGTVIPGTAVRIATGGVVPQGATQVVIQEATERRDEWIRLAACEGAPSFIRHAGSDFKAGDRVAEAGMLLTPALLGLVAAANHGSVAVRRCPRVAILASGDELREPGSSLGYGDVVNSASYALGALAEQWGATVTRHPILPDDEASCRGQLERARLAADILIPLGGASVGDRDRLRPLFHGLGARSLFEMVAVQPGKPTWHARFSDGRLVLGLPGNPASAYVCAHLFLRPLLHLLLRERGDPLGFTTARLTHELAGGGERENFLRARAWVDAEGRLLAAADAPQDSGLQSPLAAANSLLRRRAGAPPAGLGDLVTVLLIGSLA